MPSSNMKLQQKEVFDVPAQESLRIAKEGAKWGLLKRINFYVEWISRLVHTGYIDLSNDYFRGLVGDVVTYMMVNGYSTEEIQEFKGKANSIETLFDRSTEIDYTFIEIFDTEFRDLVGILTHYGLHYSVRVEKVSDNTEILNMMKNLALYMDDLEMDLLAGEEVESDFGLAVERMYKLITAYTTEDEHLKYIRDVVSKRVRQIKAFVGIVKGSGKKATEDFAERYGEVLNEIHNFINAVGNPQIIEQIHQQYLAEELDKTASEIKEEKVKEILGNLLGNEEVAKKIYPKIRELMMKELEEEPEEEEEGEADEGDML